MGNLMFRLLCLMLLFSYSFTTKGQENIYGKYCYWHIVHGHCLEIKSNNNFVLTESGNVYPTPTWTGKWTTYGDTIILTFDSNSMGTFTHIIESEYLIRTNLKKSILVKDTFQLEPPGYLYKKTGYYNDGTIRCELNWRDISTFNFIPTPSGQWKFYFSNGTLQRTENYKKGKLNGEIINYDNEGNCITIEKWKNGNLKKTKGCPKQTLPTNLKENKNG